MMNEPVTMPTKAGPR